MSIRKLAAALCVLMLLAACAEDMPAPVSASVSEADSTGLMAVEWPEGSAPAESLPDTEAVDAEPYAGTREHLELFPNAIPLENGYIQSVADGALSEIVAEGMTDAERLRAAYEWIIARAYFEEPVGLDIWRYREGDGPAPPFVENRALSLLLWGLGECEDYAAAMTVLARRMGYEAEYVFGMTISIHGEWVDHAWCVVKVDGRWYHLDPQLEDNIMRQGRINNRYFMRSDSVMRSDHIWGEALIERRPELTDGQIKRIRGELTPPACAADTAPAGPRPFEKEPRPDRERIERLLEGERAAYEALHGALPPLLLNTEPPMEIYDPEVY